MNNQAKVFLFGFLASCSAALFLGGGSGCSLGGSSSSNGKAKVDLNDPNALSFDISNIDVAATSNASALSVKQKEAATTNTARSGCELDRIYQEAIRLGKETDVIRCHFKAGIDASGQEVPTNGYLYLSADDGHIKAKVGDFNGERRMFACKDDLLALELRTQLSGTTLTADMVNHFSDSHPDENGESVSFDDKMSGSLNFTLADGATQVNRDTVTGGSADFQFVGHFGQGSLTFGLNNGINDASGVFNADFGQGGSQDAQLVGQWDATEGAGKFSVAGSHPALTSDNLPQGIPFTIPSGKGVCPLKDCNPDTASKAAACQVKSPAASCFCLELVDLSAGCIFTASGTEAFTITYDEITKTKTYTLAADNAFSTALADVSFPIIVSPSDFSETWDCTGNFIEVHPSADAITACEQLQAETSGEGQDHDTCAAEQGEQNAETANKGIGSGGSSGSGGGQTTPQAANLCGNWTAGSGNQFLQGAFTLSAASGSSCGAASATYTGTAPAGSQTLTITITQAGGSCTMTTQIHGASGTCGTLSTCTSSSLQGNCTMPESPDIKALNYQKS